MAVGPSPPAAVGIGRRGRRPPWASAARLVSTLCRGGPGVAAAARATAINHNGQVVAETDNGPVLLTPNRSPLS